MLPIRSEKVTELQVHVYAVQLHFSYFKATFKLTELKNSLHECYVTVEDVTLVRWVNLRLSVTSCCIVVLLAYGL